MSFISYFTDNRDIARKEGDVHTVTAAEALILKMIPPLVTLILRQMTLTFLHCHVMQVEKPVLHHRIEQGLVPYANYCRRNPRYEAKH